MTRVFDTSDATLVVDEERGGRIRSLRIFGVEILVAEQDDPLLWGCYPMAPWAGRVRHGRFSFDGRDHRLPLRMPPHAIHGTVLDREWRWTSSDVLETSLGEAWPFDGRAIQRFRLEPGRLVIEMELQTTGDEFPASIGWHPWFRRRLDRGADAVLDFSARTMWPRDDEGVPTGEKILPTDGPWDDCFSDVDGMITLEWPGFLRLALDSTADYWIVFDEPRHAVCIEPQTGPPDALNLAPMRVTRASPLTARFSLQWSALS